MQVAISAGHHPKSPGACYENRCEYGETMPIVAEIIRHLSRQGIDAYLVGTGFLTRKIDDIQDLNPNCCVEIHFNAAPAHGVTGCETLHYPESESGKNLAKLIQQELPKATKNPDRGIKPGYHYDGHGQINGPLAFLADTPCPAVIIEPLFIENEPEILEDDWKLQKIGMAIAKGIKLWGV